MMVEQLQLAVFAVYILPWRFMSAEEWFDVQGVRRGSVSISVDGMDRRERETF